MAGVDDERIVFVSDALQARLDAFCADDAAHDATSVTFAAIEHFGAELPQLVHDARVRLASPVADETAVRHLGVGPVRVRLRVGASGARLLDRLSAELGRPWRTWVPAVLNAFLPGRREPENMPWLASGR